MDSRLLGNDKRSGMKKYWWILMLAISYIIYNFVMIIGEMYFPSKRPITNLIAIVFGIFLVMWLFKGYFPKKNKQKKIKK